MKDIEVMSWLFINTGVAITLWFQMAIYKYIHSVEHKNKKRREKDLEWREQHQQWVFDSFYSLNPNVLLPDHFEEDEKPVKGSVYNPQKDPFSEFNGEKSDWHD